MLLNTHTYFSLKYGTWKPEALLRQALEWGYDCVCVTDINNTSACLDSLRIGQKLGVKVVPGVDFRNGVNQCFVAIAKSNEGFEQINRLLTRHLHTGVSVPEVAPEMDDVCVVYPFDVVSAKEAVLQEVLKQPSGRAFIGVRPYELQRLRFSALRHHEDRMVVMATVSFRGQRDFNAHRLLRAIDNNTLLSKLPKQEEGDPRHVLVPRDELERCYTDHPSLIDATRVLLEQCAVDFEFGDSVPPKNKATYTGSVEGDYQMIRRLCSENLPYRYPQLDDTITSRIEKELEIIRDKGCLLYTSPSPRDQRGSRMPSSA